MIFVLLSVVVLVVALVGGGTIAGRRMGYRVGGDVIVRCSQGHLFTTIWIPFVSLNAVRLGSRRFQRCPVGGGHWSLVRMVRDAELTVSERAMAAKFHDVRLP